MPDTLNQETAPRQLSHVFHLSLREHHTLKQQVMILTPTHKNFRTVWRASLFHLVFHLASVQGKDLKAMAHQVEAVQALQSEVLQNLDIGVEMLHGLNENAVSLDNQMKSSLQLQVRFFDNITSSLCGFEIVQFHNHFNQASLQGW